MAYVCFALRVWDPGGVPARRGIWFGLRYGLSLRCGVSPRFATCTVPSEFWIDMLLA